MRAARSTVRTAATVFTAGFRIGLNVRTSNVIDVGYSGVVGANRIVNGQSPYGHFPVEDQLPACGRADADGEVRERVQTNGRCESANPQGDTYGPVAYEAYVPGYMILGWTGKWDDLPAAHLSSILFDLLCLLGVALVGLRFGGMRLAVTLAFAWVAYPFTLYVSSANTNDALPPLFLIWGFWLVTSPLARGAAVALAGWTKFAPLLLAPLWASYPERRWRPTWVFAAGFLAATAAAFAILLLDDERRFLTVRAASGFDPETDGAVPIPFGEGMAGSVAASGKPARRRGAWVHSASSLECAAMAKSSRSTRRSRRSLSAAASSIP